MPTIDWIGKSAVAGHHQQLPYRLLRCDRDLSVGEAEDGSLLVHGDNLEALKALLPYYARKVRCIYIDPPYNTGKEGWIYNDNVNSPEIRKWLGQVVGKESEDLTRHDKWLCMLLPRLMLLKKFLCDDGVIFISIGKDEIGNLRALCDEVFGRKALIEVFIWQVEGNVENQEAVTAVHEYVLAYERNAGQSRINRTIDPNVPDDSKILRDFVENSAVKNGAANPASEITLPAGFPCAVDAMTHPAHPFAQQFVDEVAAGPKYIQREMRATYGANYPIRLDDMVVENGELVAPCRVFSGWQAARKLQLFIDNGCVPLVESDGARIRYFLSHTGVPTYRKDARQAHAVETILRNMGTTERASNELERMGIRFPYPKPPFLIQYLLGLYARPGDYVMDSFAGSGTTGEAALRLATEGIPDLKFLLVELEDHIAKDVTAPRLRACIEGYETRRGSRTVAVPGLGGGFRYCRLGNPLFDESGVVADAVSFTDLAAHIYFTETGSPIEKRARRDNPLLGVHGDRAIYLLYNGVLGDRTPRGGNVLTHSVAASLPPHPDGLGPRVVYGEACRLGKKALSTYGITFRQIPFDLQVG